MHPTLDLSEIGQRPGGPPGEAGPAQVIETHTSLLFFVDDLVYKLKKAVDFGFLDLRDKATRRLVCEAEVALNRRFSPDVYLGVADLVGPTGIAWDSLVVMRRMPLDRRLSTLVTSQAESASISSGLRSIARIIASFHEAAATSPEIAATGDPDALRALWRGNLEVLQRYSTAVIDPAVAVAIEQLSTQYLAGREPLLRLRQGLGMVRDGHGDLQSDDVFMLEDGPRILDCLEFDARLRCGDVLNDVAFLAMDLERLGAAGAARTFLDAYAEFSGEDHPRSLEDLYIAYRAGVRSKVACLRWAQGEQSAAELARSYAAIALRHLKLARVQLVLIGGLPGTGKSTVATSIASAHDAKDWTLLRSDVVRKELACLPSSESAAAPFGQGRYTPESRRTTYDELLRRARCALELGESVIIDASFTSEDERTRARQLARETWSQLTELECHAPADVVAERIGNRVKRGSDASDADAAISRAMTAGAIPWPTAVPIDTSADLATVTDAVRAALSGDQT